MGFLRIISLIIISSLSTTVDESLSGGETTVFQDGQNAFSLPLANISRENRRAHVIGNSFFNKNWVIAPASTTARDGLGPLFNARSCSECHLRDGRGAPPVGDEPLVGLLFRLSLPGKTETGGPFPVPSLGTQLGVRAIPGVEPEGNVRITYEEIEGTFADGNVYSLRKPRYEILAGTELPENLLISPRLALPVHGLGLLEAIPEEALLAAEDPDDKNGDGISGRANRVWNPETARVGTGRFGWKANQPTLRQQTASAFHGDIGITSAIHPQEALTESQFEKMSEVYIDPEPELDEKTLNRVVVYQQTLAPPARRDLKDPKVIRGKALFTQANCTACHTPEWQTAEAVPGIPELAGQTIRPYTDMLLHDMGPDLADGRPDFEASGSEWRTPPLWGIGLTEAVNGHTFFLHDGRARNLEEAILWHGGEAEASREMY
ncbi:MAG: di-heme oxidoredictase family protein, partial [Verrucomicrobiales bacterium]|nr:di-heme oxidoredictase family protein [Verrucomicrobiales bacterium]